MTRFTLRALCSLAALLPLAAFAQDEPAFDQSTDTPAKLTISADARVDFAWHDFSAQKNEANFYGKYLDVMLDGYITPELSYHFRQRLNKLGELRNDVFGATDWIYVDYRPIQQFSVAGGKQVVCIGGYEYDRAPIDIFFASLYWHDIACYQFGVSATWHSPGDKHNITFQFCNSPYATIGQSCFAYNLMWAGNMGWFHTLWSVNLLEYERGKFENYIALGNRADFGNFYAELDLMNRYSRYQKFLLGDYSVIAKAAYSFNRHFDVFAKGGYERYRPVPGEAARVDKPFYGVGLECYPLKKSRMLRLHLAGDVIHDNEGQRIAEVQCGVTWQMDIFTLK